MNRSIVVVGSVNLDLVCTVDRIPLPGETLAGSRFQTFHGGKGANQAVAAARLAADVAMVARVGDDSFGTALREGLRAASVGVAEVETVAGVASGVAMIAVDRSGQNSIIVVPGANGELRPLDLERCRSRLESAGLLMAQLEVPMETVEALCWLARRGGVPLMLDPAPARELSPQMLRAVTYMTPNETETAALCGLREEDLVGDRLTEAADALLAQGPENVLLKLGARGVFLAGADGTRALVPSFDVAVVDSTAAGDAFNGGLASALMRGLPLLAATQYAVAVAALSVTRAGAQASMPNAPEVSRFLEQHRS